MIVNTYEKNGRKAEIHQETQHYFVKLYEGNRLIKVEDLSGHSLFYAESLAENFTDRIGGFRSDVVEKAFLTE